jgi:uncharacterized protein (TIGR02246 family)
VRVDESAIAGVLAAQVEAWNRGDLDGFCAPYAEDVVYLRATDVVVGRAALRSAYAQRFGGSIGTLALRIVKLDPVGDAAFAVVEWRLTAGDRSTSGHALLGFRQKGAGIELAYDATVAP